MATTIERASAAAVEVAPDQRIVLHGVSWETYESLLADHVDRSVPHFTYDRGELEIVSPSTPHEEDNRTLALLVELVAIELAIDVRNVGSMTFKRADLEQGVEPDSCFYIQSEPKVRGRRQIDPAADPPPDLVIEIDVTRRSLDKLPIYARIGVPEVWRIKDGRVAIHLLQGGVYRASTVSSALPILTRDVLNRFLTQSRSLKRSAWVRTLHEWIRSSTAGEP